ncbi:MAG: 30S ribosomal protein S1 [Phycisphaerales bacterium]|nr:30S ribosomal protein S1 [Phycisphaerales bacterium]
MVDHILLNELDITDSDLLTALGDVDADLSSLGMGFNEKDDVCKAGTILSGRVICRAGDDVVVDVGLKSEGTIPSNEWDDPAQIKPGEKVDVWLDAIESDTGQIVLSKRKADRALNWKRIVETRNEGDIVTGRVMRKIKGGLLVDIGVPVFLPASQVDVRRPGDIAEFIGKDIQAKVLKIDTERRNIVISRRELIEEERATAKEKLMSTIAVGQIRQGKVKNIANFGVFVDLGGIDGLLHITDMSWDRVGHPSELVKIDELLDVKILNVDKDKEKIALGIKQLQSNPWDSIEERYPVNNRIKGEVVNITNYGAFIKIEPGVEGLVHISEMSWTRRINHPSELLAVGQQVEAVVLDVDKNKQEISLGIKQIDANPWTKVAEKYPPNTRIKGIVRNLTNYGVFVEIEEGIDGLLHISDMSWTKKISHPSEMLKKGDEIECVVLEVDESKQRIALGLRQLHEDPWLHAVPANYIPGQIVEGTVTKITNFGVFVELEPDLEGLLHVSELADHKVEDPHDEVKIGDRIQVKILRVDTSERKIGLSKKRAAWSSEQQAEADDTESKGRERRGGLQQGTIEMPRGAQGAGADDDAASDDEN